MKFSSKGSFFSLIFHVLVHLSTQCSLNEDQFYSCDSPNGPLKLCLIHQNPTGFTLQWTEPLTTNISVHIRTINYTIEDKQEGKNYTLKYYSAKTDKINYWIEISGLEVERSYSFYLEVMSQSYSEGSNKFVHHESHVDLEFSCDINNCVDKEKLKFENENARVVGKMTWTHPPGHYGENVVQTDEKYRIINLENNELENIYSIDIYLNRTFSTTYVPYLKKNTSYILMVDSSCGDALVFFKTKESYAYPVKPTDLHITEGKIDYSYSPTTIKWYTPDDIMDRYGRLNRVSFKIVVTNLKTKRQYTKRTQNHSYKFNLPPCTKFNATVKADFKSNYSYSEESFEFTTQNNAPEATYADIKVSGQNVTITYDTTISSGCLPSGFRINATGISTWDDVVDRTEILTIHEKEFTFTNLYPATKYTFTHVPFNDKGDYKSWYINNQEATTEDLEPYPVTSVKVDQTIGKSLKVKWTVEDRTPGKVLRYWIDLLDDSRKSVFLSSVPSNVRQLNIQRQDLRDRQLIAAVWPENSIGNGTKVFS